MSAQQQLNDSYIRHNVLMQRYSKGVAKKTMAETERLMNQLVALIESSTSGLDQLRYVAMYREIASLNAAAFERINGILNESRAETVQFEIKATAEQIETYAKTPKPLIVPDAEQVIRIANMAPLFDETSQTMAAVMAGLESKTLKMVDNAIRDGILTGQTNRQIANSVKDLTALTKRNAEAVSLTAISQATNQSRQQFHKANADILDGEIFLATLDSRTTLTCASKDQKVYPVGVGPYPPLHVRCRSLRTPKVNEKYLPIVPGGARPSKGADGAELVAPETTYQSFLRRQPAEFQDSVLGKERAKLFRSGALSLDKFVDESGRTYTLDELRAQYPKLMGNAR